MEYAIETVKTEMLVPQSNFAERDMDVMRAAIQLCCPFCHKHHFERLLTSRQASPTCINLAGGVARSDVWPQMFADITQLPVETVDINETGALGRAITGVVATGAFDSFSTASASMVRVSERYTSKSECVFAYQQRCDVYVKTFNSLDSLW